MPSTRRPPSRPQAETCSSPSLSPPLFAVRLFTGRLSAYFQYQSQQFFCLGGLQRLADLSHLLPGDRHDGIVIGPALWTERNFKRTRVTRKRFADNHLALQQA